MKVLHISTSDLIGGGAIAAYRLHCSLNNEGIDSKMLVQRKESSDPKVISPNSFFDRIKRYLIVRINRLPIKFYRDRNKILFSANIIGIDLSKYVNEFNPDIIHLHWVANGWLSYKTLRAFNKPIVWTMHDMWAFTGGCHHTGECEGYFSNCGKCPVLGSANQNDLSKYLLQSKKINYTNKIDRIISPSNWLASKINRSAVFSNKKVTTIPYGVNTNIFSPRDKLNARKSLGLPAHKKIILFGATYATTNPFKGWDLLLNALSAIPNNNNNNNNYLLLVFGNERDDLTNINGIPIHYLGSIKDENKMSVIYNSADIFVVPSKEDNLPNTIIESMSCGTPCIAFKTGGIPDLIENNKNGILIEKFDINKMANAIFNLCNDTNSLRLFSSNCRESVLANFDKKKQSGLYINIYNELLTSKSENS